MEILELIFGGLQLCDCLVGLLSLISATGGAVEARRGTANRRERRIAKQAGEKPPPVSRENWIALILFLLAVVLLSILAFTWLTWLASHA
jgi:hypothetical protein